MHLKRLLLIVVGACSADAFVVSSSRTHCRVSAEQSTMTTESVTVLHSKTRLQYRNQDEDDILYTESADATAAASLLNDPSKIPKAIFLPRLSQNKRRTEQMMDTEIILGRIAMMASIVMISAELSAGTSLPDQIYNLSHF